MLATVFYVLSVGQLIACLVSLVVTSVLQQNLMGEYANSTERIDDSYRTTDIV
jgi:hypothetical protein